MKSSEGTSVFYNQIRIFIFGMFLVLSPSYAGKTGHHLPDLGSDKAKLEFLLEVKDKYVSTLFEEAAQYNIDVFALAENERELTDLLRKKHPVEYEKLFQQKRYFDLSIKPPREGFPVGSVKIRPEALEGWRSELDQFADQLKVEGRWGPENFPSKIQELRSQIRGEDPKLILERIGARDEPSGHPRKKGEQIRFDQAKWDTLLRCKAGRELKQRFECLQSHYEQLVGLPNLPSESQIVDILSSLNAEEKFNAILSLEVVKLKSSHRPDDRAIQTWDEMKKAVRDLNAEDLIDLEDREDVLKPLAQKALGGGLNPLSDLEKRSLDRIHKSVKKFASDTLSVPQIAQAPVRISQVLPQVGIFRGCTGGDCSSRFSFPYPNDPHEMVFFIEDTEEGSKPPEEVKSEVGAHDKQMKRVKGYLSATVVDLPSGKKGLYVITMSGKKVSAKDTEVILRGLEEKKKELGVDHILLPVSSQIESLMNFPEIKGVYNSHIEGKDEVPIRYQASGIRKRIEEYRPESGYNEGSYDHSSMNTQGVILSFKEKKGLHPQVDLQVHDDLTLSSQDLSQHSKKEILELLLDLHHSRRSDAVSRVLAIKELGDVAHEFYQILSLIHQGNGGSVSEFKEKIHSGLSRFGAADLLERKKYLIYPGILNCTDVLSKENREEAAKWIVKDFKDHDFKPVFIDWQGLDPEVRDVLFETQIFKGILSDLLKKLTDQDFENRRKAITAIEQLRADRADVLRALIHSLGDTEWLVRGSVVDALGVIVSQSSKIDPALRLALENALLGTLKDSDADVRQKSAEAFRKLKPENPAVHQALVEALSDSYNGTRRSAADALGEIKPENLRIHEVLAQHLMDASTGVRRGVGYALQEIYRFKLSQARKPQFEKCLKEASLDPISQEKLNEILDLMKEMNRKSDEAGQGEHR